MYINYIYSIIIYTIQNRLFYPKNRISFFFIDLENRDKIRVHRTLLFPLRSSSSHKLTVKLKNYNAGEARMNDDVHHREKDKASKTLVD